MTRIVLWNIEEFEYSKIYDNRKDMDATYKIANDQAAKDRCEYILRTLFSATDPKPGGGDVTPGIIIIIEVLAFKRAAKGASGGAAGPAAIQPAQGLLFWKGTEGGDGAMVLLEQIRTRTKNNKWMLVPPVSTGGGGSEAVAIYYDSNQFLFTGPWLWPGGFGPAADPDLFTQPPQVYQDPYNNSLPSREIPGGLPNAGKYENMVAGTTSFTPLPTSTPLAKPERTPYRVTLAEGDFSQIKPRIDRLLSLIVIHGPANAAKAKKYLENLLAFDEIGGALSEDIRLVLGDFNLNVFESKLTLQNSYQRFKDAGFELAIDVPPRLPKAPDQFDEGGYYGYFATHMQQYDQATYSSAKKQGAQPYNNLYYPGYGYIGSEGRPARFYAFDNVLAKPKVPVAAGVRILRNVTILNGVVGVPFRALTHEGYWVRPPDPAFPLPEVPRGYFKFDPQLQQLLPVGALDILRDRPDVLINTNDPDPTATMTRFLEWANFGHIRSTSDHMPILFEI